MPTQAASDDLTSNRDRYYRSQVEMPESMRELMEQIAFEYAETYDSYLVTEDDREYFWNRKGTGFIGFYRRRRRVIATGGVLAPLEDRESLLAEFMEFARRQRWSVIFFNIPRAYSSLYRKSGFQITKCGEEPIIQLDRTQWQGKTTNGSVGRKTIARSRASSFAS